MAETTKVRRETTREKGKRLHDAGCVTKVGHDRYEVEGSSGKYAVERCGTFLRCSCPAQKGDCSHVEAVHCAIDAEMRAAHPEPTPEETADFLGALGWTMPANLDDDDDEAQGDEQGQLTIF